MASAGTMGFNVLPLLTALQYYTWMHTGFIFIKENPLFFHLLHNGNMP